MLLTSLAQPTAVPPISTLGPDALTELLPLDEFVHSLSEKKIAIKALLLDQVEENMFFTSSYYLDALSEYFLCFYIPNAVSFLLYCPHVWSVCVTLSC